MYVAARRNPDGVWIIAAPIHGAGSALAQDHGTRTGARNRRVPFATIREQPGMKISPLHDRVTVKRPNEGRKTDCLSIQLFTLGAQL